MPVSNDYVCNDLYRVENCAVKLQNGDLWQRFHRYQTEMIITKGGRRLYPVPAFDVSELDPMQDYCVFLEMVLVSRCRYKYAPTVGWSPAGPEESQSNRRLYLHPQSPAKGAHWMSKDILFDKLKVTNTSCNPPRDQIVLSSMHKYQPRLIILMSSNPSNLTVAQSKCVSFTETEFFAVTAYQNKDIIRLKILNNPYAKGFLKNDKRKSIDEEPLDLNKTRSPSPEYQTGRSSTPECKSRRSSSPRPIPGISLPEPRQCSIQISDESQKTNCQQPTTTKMPTESYYQNLAPVRHCYPYYYGYSPDQNFPPFAWDYHLYCQQILVNQMAYESSVLRPNPYLYPGYSSSESTEGGSNRIVETKKGGDVLSEKAKRFMIDAILES